MISWVITFVILLAVALLIGIIVFSVGSSKCTIDSDCGQIQTCINDKCSTHKEPQLKNAVFYRQKGSYTTRYICTVCDSFWNTFIEK